MKRVLILAEGQTEERFVKTILQPHLWPIGVHAEPKIAVTKRIKSGGQFKGGVADFGKVEDDLRRLLRDRDAAMITTLLDYYKFPRDFPGWKNAKGGQPEQRARQLEESLEKYFGDRRFRAFLMLHEYEAMLFSDPDLIARTMNRPNEAARLIKIRDESSGPEKIDDGEATHPSQRLLDLFPGYRKPLHGPLIIGRIGLEQVRNACPHFREWLSDLEALGEKRRGVGSP